MIKRSALLSLAPFLALSFGCPTPVEPPSPDQVPAMDGSAPPPQDAAPAGVEGGNAAATQLPVGERPSFASVIEGDTITVTVTIVGDGEGQIDFTDMSEADHPMALHVEPFSGPGSYEVTAPASYPKTLMVSAASFGDDAMAAEPKALTLGAVDATVTLTLAPAPVDAKLPPRDPQGEAVPMPPAEPAEPAAAPE